jgi:hypothetical protein
VLHVKCLVVMQKSELHLPPTLGRRLPRCIVPKDDYNSTDMFVYDVCSSISSIGASRAIVRPLRLRLCGVQMSRQHQHSVFGCLNQQDFAKLNLFLLSHTSPSSSNGPPIDARHSLDGNQHPFLS